MQNLKAALLVVGVIIAIGVLGWWAFQTLEPGDVHAERERIKTLENESEELREKVKNLENELARLAPPEPAQESPPPAPEPAPVSSKYQSLIGDLQKLTDDKVYMKVGSKGTRVGTVQNFLNIYFKTSKKIDNDYGKGMKTDVANFQKAVGLTADGETGPATYEKMIDWLKKNS
ncbi:MAG: peptidoglycan-binding domain-containing protein [Patescibacteria group bacterium]